MLITNAVFPGAIVRVCQFHVVQAIGRADFHATKPDGTSTQTKNRVTVGLPLRRDVTNLFRRVQRFRGQADPKSWEEYRRDFDEGVREACEKHDNEAAAAPVLTYFEKYWFSEYWRSDYFALELDYGY